MSSIDKMQIRGIRSFSPNKDETIEFYAPLTMIVGANGCGKTTIIESLKMACTGALPPNIKNGQSLLNDPAMTDATSVKGQIKLRFENQGGSTCVAVRSLQVTRKKTKLEFKQIESVLRTTNARGEKTSISMKCSEIDSIIPENLGISPAILENVIFVHQEDCNWPMQESIQLKKRFDDVFESTRYTKALEAIRKTRLEIQSKAKDIKGELMEFAAHLQSAQASSSERESCIQQQNECNEYLEGLALDITDKQARLQECEAVLEQAREQDQQLQQLEWRVGESERRVQDKEKQLDRVLNESDEELQRSVDEFDQVMQARQAELEEVQQKLDENASDISHLRGRAEALNHKKGQAALLQDQFKQHREQQSQLGAELQHKYALPGAVPSAGSSSGTGNSIWSLAAVRNFMQNLDNKLFSVQSEGTVAVNEATQAVNEEEQAYQGLQTEMQTIEVELRLKDEEIVKMKKTESDWKLELSRLSASSNVLKQRQVEYDQQKQSHDEFATIYETRLQDCQNKVLSIDQRLADLHGDLTSERSLLDELKPIRGQMVAADERIKQANEDAEKEVGRLRAIYACYATQLAGQSEPQSVNELDQLRVYVEDSTSKIREENVLISDELATLHNGHNTDKVLFEQSKGHRQELLRRVEVLEAQKRTSLMSKVNTLNQLIGHPLLEPSGILAVSMQANIEDVLKTARTVELEAKNLVIIAKSARIFMKRFANARQVNPGACPCCGQAMDAALEQVYDTNIKKLLNSSATSDAAPASDGEGGCSAEGEAAAAVDTSETLKQQFKSLHHQSTTLLAELDELQVLLQPLETMHDEIRTLDERIAEHENRWTEVGHQIAVKEALASEKQKVFNSWVALGDEMKAVLKVWQRCDEHKREAQDVKRQATQHLTAIDLGDRSFEDIEQRCSFLSTEKDELVQTKDRLQKEKDKLQVHAAELRSNFAKAEKALSEARASSTRLVELEQSLSKLHAQLAEIDQRKDVLAREREEMTRVILEKQTLVNHRRTHLQKIQATAQEKVSSITTDKANFQRVLDAISQVDSQLQLSNLDGVAQELEGIHESIRTKEEENVSLNVVVNTTTSDLASQEHTRRNILANIDLRTITNELLSHRTELQTLRDQQKRKNDGQTALTTATGGVLSLQEAERKHEVYKKQMFALISKRDQMTGKLETYAEQVENLDRKLNLPDYKNIDERHRRKNIDYETTLLAAVDLENYHNALDKALQTFHTMKIREINKIIRELWSLIYQGQDIDSIEIESGHEDGAAASVASSTAKGSRSYHYRVVMSKGDIPLDMRGRCSAGQKVLASIVIRLALAETFCLNCGMLALDEPTTNLDEANKQGLAHALARIIMSRSSQHNFQLICITHDEDFVKMMNNELSSTADFRLPEYFFRVYRQEEGTTGKFFSHIERVPWDDI